MNNNVFFIYYIYVFLVISEGHMVIYLYQKYHKNSNICKYYNVI